MLHRVFTVLLLSLLLLFFSMDLFALPANLKWKTLETEHFRINYEQNLENMAKFVAKLAEQVHSQLSSLLEYDPSMKTEMVLVDHVDTPNGLVNVYPYNKMILYAVPPNRKSGLNDYDDWLRVLIAHEHTHIIQLDTKSGVPKVINHILGGQIHPNQYMPRWYTEGLAIHDESLLTAGGRQRSSLYEMYLRADVLEGNFREIDEITGQTHEWPRGVVPYLYGAKFMQFLSDKYNKETFAALGFLYGERLIPYALSTVLKKVTNDNFPRLYEEWKQSLISRYKEETKRTESLGITELNMITNTGPNHDTPVLFPTGDKVLYFHDADKMCEEGYMVLDLNTMKYKKLIGTDSNGGVTISPDGHRIVTSQITGNDKGYSYYELYLHDIQNNIDKQLTKMERAREPSFSPEGNKVVYVKYAPGTSYLKMMNIDNGDNWKVFEKSPLDQVLTPSWSPDGRYIAFIGWKWGSFKDLYLYDTKNKELRQLSKDQALDMSPSWSWDSQKIYWSNDRTGTFNVYTYDIKTSKVKQATNVINGAFSPLAIPGGKKLIVSSYSHKGFDLAYVDLEKQGLISSIDSIDMRKKKHYEDPDVTYEQRDYSPFPSLYPKVWKPTFGEDYDGKTLGISVFGDDIVGYHSWSAEVDMGLSSGIPTASFSYTNRAFVPSFGLRASHVSYSLPEGITQGNEKVAQNEARTSGSVSIGFPFTGRYLHNQETWTSSHRISFGYSFRHTRMLNTFEFEPTEPEPKFTNTGLSSGFSIGWSYSNRRSWSGYTGSTSGRSIFLSVHGNTSILGSESNSLTVSGGYSEFIAIPWVDYHSLALKFVGGFGISDYSNRNLFYIGGPPEADMVNNIIRDERSYGTYLRGYEPLSMGGNKYFLFKSEYRIAIWHIEKGIYTLPIFFGKLHIAPFFDVGYAWQNDFHYDQFKKGIGGELRLDILLGYVRAITLKMGYQYGFDDKGVSAMFFGLDNVF